jgi:glycosyltransferase involved in cell wall biosynthesis
MNYRLLFVAFIGGEFGGIEQKLIAQFDALQSCGVDIHMFLISKVVSSERLVKEIVKRPDISIVFNSADRVNNPWLRRKEKFDLILVKLSDFDPKNTIVYFRDPQSDILFLRFLKSCKNFRFVTEHQDIENTFSKGIFKGRFLINTLELIWGRACRKMITGFVSVTTEITSYERSLAGDKNHFYETIGNGIDILRYPLRIPESDFHDNEIRILFIGSGFRTHGLDRLIKSIYEYYKNKDNKYDIRLRVAGDSHEMYLNKDLVNKLGLFSNVSFLGNLKSENLNELFDWAQIGVGSLGIHRKGLKYTSELKAREYCVRGLPFFWSTSDQDFDQDFPYILNLPESDSTFDMGPVISFALKMTSEENHPLKMRQYAVEHLDWSVKMRKLKSFLDEIMKDFN